MIPYFDIHNVSLTKFVTFLIIKIVSKTNLKCNHVFYQTDINQFTCHTTGCYTGKRIAKLSIWIKHFRDNSFLSARFPETNHFLVFCVQRIIVVPLLCCRSWLEWLYCCVIAGLYYVSCLQQFADQVLL